MVSFLGCNMFGDPCMCFQACVHGSPCSLSVEDPLTWIRNIVYIPWRRKTFTHPNVLRLLRLREMYDRQNRCITGSTEKKDG